MFSFVVVTFSYCGRRECGSECIWHHDTFLVHFSIGNIIVFYCIVYCIVLNLFPCYLIITAKTASYWRGEGKGAAEEREAGERETKRERGERER